MDIRLETRVHSRTRSIFVRISAIDLGFARRTGHGTLAARWSFIPMMNLRHLGLVLGVVAAGVVAAARPRTASAGDATSDLAERTERCATRLYTAMIGEGAPASAATAKDPLADVDALLEEPRFIERFARFANSQMNNAPGAKPAEDASKAKSKNDHEND
jgi:hypothetical protein